MKSTQDRANLLETKILDAIENGEFSMGCGYLDQVLCTGCALAAAAFVFGGWPGVNYVAGTICRDVVTCADVSSDERVSRREILQLEMGYEHFASMVDSSSGNCVDADRQNPFYKLGRRLRDFS